MPCKPCQANAARKTFRVPADPAAAAAQAGAANEYEVIDARGRSTGRTFTSLVAASNYAGRIGGSTRPVD